ncbi:MAG: carboxypeptidase-like regulatory domain-containing protein [Candidatus Aenigmatarchaeota archaeon]
MKSNNIYDVYLKWDDYLFLVNTSYDTEYVQESNLTRQWYVKLNVTDKNGAGIQDAQVSAKDKYGNTEWTDTTDSNGLTEWKITTQYIHNQNGIFNYTPYNISGSHSSYPSNFTIQNIIESKIIYLPLKMPLITFNVTSGEDGSSLDNVAVTCNYSSFSQSGDTTNTYGPYEFPSGSWWCIFEKINYYNKTMVFISNSDKTVDVVMSYKYHLTNEEHTWIESIYNCLINKNCDVYDLWNQTYEYASNIWDQFKQTDESVVVSEQTTSSVVNATSNLTIEYAIDVPIKEDYQFLPIRIFYWFMDENNEICYNQAKEGNNAEAPFCNPLVTQTIGEVNTQINFTVDLRPNLPEGNYTIVRRIDIDPENVWINYGHEAIGRLEVIAGSDVSGIQLNMNGNSVKQQELAIQTTAQSEQFANDKSTGMIIFQQIDSVSYVAVIVSVITLVLVGLMFKNSRKRTPWGS